MEHQAVGTVVREWQQDRVHRLRRSARAHRAAAAAVRGAQAVAGRAGVRGRHRGMQPAARAGLDRAGHLLRLAGPRPCGRAGRAGLHPARAGLHPGAVRAVPGGHAAAVGEGRRSRSGRCGGRGRGPGPGPGSGPAGTRAGKAARARRFRWWRACWPAAAAATVGPWLVLVLLGCGLAELALRWPRDDVPCNGASGRGGKPRGGGAALVAVSRRLVRGAGRAAWVRFRWERCRSAAVLPR